MATKQHHGIFKWTVLVFLLTSFSITIAQQQWTRINYISGKTVYVAAGKANGIHQGDTLKVYHNKRFIGMLKVEYVARHSASCSILQASIPLKKGFPVGYIPHKTVVKQQKPSPAQPTPAQVAAPPPKRRNRASSHRTIRIRGGLGVSFFQSTATDNPGFSYRRPSLRLRMKIDRLPGDHRIEISLRTYQIQRTQTLASLPTTENRYRLYSFMIEQNAPEHALNYQIGRINAYPISGLGYLDGALVNFRVVPAVRVGMFGGTEPNWDTFAFQSNAPKYGAYVIFDHHQAAVQFSTTGAFITSSIQGVENRTYLYSRQTLTLNNAFYFSGSFEIDINRGWRKERTGHALSFTNLFLLAQYRLPGGHAISISYDNRRNYWTYFYRTLSDSLFDTRIRQGARLNVTLRLPWQTYFSAYGNANIREAEKRFAISGGFQVMKRNLFHPRAAGGLRGNFFRDTFATGGFGQLWGQYYVLSTLYTRLALGYRAYQLGTNTRQNQWIRGEIDWQVLRHISCTGILEHHTGDDFAGNQYFVEFHYNF